MSAFTPASITIQMPPRNPGQGPHLTGTFSVQTVHGSFAWGSSPGRAAMTYIGSNIGISFGSLVSLQIGKLLFVGVCQSDSEVNGSRGSVRTLEFADLRDFLTWDWVRCCFNKTERTLIGGVWRKRYWHIYPFDVYTMTKTYTDYPLLAWEILSAVLSAPSVGSPWIWNLTGNGEFPQGLMNGAIYDVDFLNGMRLDAALNLITEKCGLVFGLDSSTGNVYRLVWTCKGRGLLPVFGNGTNFPPNSDERRAGTALSGNATNINVVGDRNRYQILNLPLVQDWAAAWGQFLVVDGLAKDLFDFEKDPTSGERYNAMTNDAEQWRGSNLAQARALEITVGEYVDLRNIRDGNGNQFIDQRKFGGRSRMNMPAALYIQNLVFRAFKVNLDFITNFYGQSIPLISTRIADEQLCVVTYDPKTGDMDDVPDRLTDGNGLAIVKGYQFGQDFFRLVNPEKIPSDFGQASARYWAAASFQADDSGQGDRFIIFDAPVFVSDNLFVKKDDLMVMNAGFTLTIPSVKAALTFEAELYSYWKGTYPNVSRDQVENVSGLRGEFSGTPGNYVEILYSNGLTADEQADIVAEGLLQRQYSYFFGGYVLKWKADKPVSQFGDGINLTGMVDRIEMELSPTAIQATVDFTAERKRDSFEPERDLDRATIQNSMFPGQEALKKQSDDHKKIAGVIKQMPKEQFSMFLRFLKGDFGDGVVSVSFNNAPATPLDAGTPIYKKASSAGANVVAVHPQQADIDTKVFCGVTVRDAENVQKNLTTSLGSHGLWPARVQGPINENDSVGYSAKLGDTFLIKNGIPSVGVAQQKIANGDTKLVMVKFGAGGGTGGDPVWL